MRILVVDDDGSTLAVLEQVLRALGYDVVTATDGQQAFDLLHQQHIPLVISDWMMPKLDGLELCRRIRAAGFSRYTYVILLTARDGKANFIEAMQAGADDVVTKPIDRAELDVRIRAAQRILRLEQDLAERNHKLAQAYATIEQDLRAAGRIQQSMLPPRASVLRGYGFGWLFMPCGFVAGDILNYYPVDAEHLAFFLLDVAGHGVPAAMLSVTLSKVLTSMTAWTSPEHHGRRPSHAPAQVARELNRRFQNAQEQASYFTMVFGLVHSPSGRVRIVQAGHPSPIHLTAQRRVNIVGDGGFPIGLLPDAVYDEQTVRLEQGDRLVVYSDGIVECTNPAGVPFSAGRLIEMLQRHEATASRARLEGVEAEMRAWRGPRAFGDDITLLVIERLG